MSSKAELTSYQCTARLLLRRLLGASLDSNASDMLSVPLPEGKMGPIVRRTLSSLSALIMTELVLQLM